jgi:hypothetical protein
MKLKEGGGRAPSTPIFGVWRTVEEKNSALPICLHLIKFSFIWNTLLSVSLFSSLSLFFSLSCLFWASHFHIGCVWWSCRVVESYFKLNFHLLSTPKKIQRRIKYWNKLPSSFFLTNLPPKVHSLESFVLFCVYLHLSLY